MKQNYIPETANEPKSPLIVASVLLSPDDELPLNETIELKESQEKADDETSPKSPLSQSSFVWDEPETKLKKKKQQQHGKDKVWWVDGVGFEKSSPDPQKRSTVEPKDDLVRTTAKGNAVQDRPVSRLTVRNLTENDIVEDSDSDSDSATDNSDW
jgi:hypothetical protein